MKKINHKKAALAIMMVVSVAVFVGGADLNIGRAQTVDSTADTSVSAPADAPAPSVDTTVVTTPDTTDVSVSTDTATTTTDVATDAPADATSTDPVVTADTSTVTDMTVSTDTTSGEVLGASVTSPTTEGAIPASQPTLTTDRPDYEPGESATIFGSFFQSFQNILVKIFGGSSVNQDYTETSVNVTTDAQGSFSTPYQLDGFFRPLYNIVATNQFGSTLAMATFNDSIPVSFEQCANENPTPGTCDWIGSILQANDSVYYEGMSVPQRIVYHAVPNGPHTISFDYSYTKGGTHAYDFITGKNQGNAGFTPGITTFGDCVGLNGQDATACTAALGGTTTTIPIPHDGFISKDGSQTSKETAYEALFGARNIDVHINSGGTFTPSSTPVVITHTVSNGGDTGDSDTHVVINFATAGCGTTPCSLAIYFDGHLSVGGSVATGTAWGPGLGSSNINGGPYHVKNLEFDGTGGSLDNQIQGASVLVPPGSITITKVTSPANSTTSFTFNGTNLSPSSVQLTGASGSNTKLWSSLANGTTYTITETPTSGWNLSSPVVCTGMTSSTVASVTNGTAVTLQKGDNITCTFTNTIAQATSTVTTAIHNASHAVVTSVPAGSIVHDSVVATGTNGTPTGNVIFNWFANGTCSGAATATSSAVALSGGTADATAFTQGPLAAGSYSFRASYAGDTHYFSASSACEPLTVTKVDPLIGTTPSAGGVVGVQVHDTANVTGGFNPSGVVTFNLYGASDASCASAPIFTSTSTLSAGSATSGNFTTAAVGTYHWTATYGGDASNNAVSSGCQDETVTVSPAAPTVATTLSAATTTVGSAVHDSATLSAGTANAGGTVTYTVYSDNACSLNPQSAGTKTVTNGVVPDSDPVTFGDAGTYYWQAAYSGDSNNSSAKSPCESEVLIVVKNSPTIATLLSSSSVALGAAVNDSATLAGATANAGGSVTYTAYTDSSCSLGAQAGGTVTVTAGSVPNSNPITFNVAGDYYWQAVYSGDANNNGATSGCTSEHLVVNKANLGIGTIIHDANHIATTTVALGSVVHDTASVTGQVGSIAPTGAVTFTFFTSPDCSTGGSAVATTGADGGAVRSADSAALAAGSYSYQASVASDANYNDATSSCEPLTVNKGAPSPTTDTQVGNGTSVRTVEASSTIHDTLSITGSFGVPTGNVTFDFFNNGACSGTPATSSASFVLVNGAVDASAFAQGPLPAGQYSFLAHYGGDSNYLATDASCEPFAVVDGSIALSPLTATNALGQSHTITVHVTENDGTGVTDASGAAVNFSITSGVATFSGPSTCSTNASGTCSVTINSSSTGANTIDATVTFDVGGVSITRATNANAGPDGTGSAAKQYVAAKIGISPSATNEVGHSHTFTVTAQQDIGSGFTGISGLHPTVTIDPVPGTTTDNCATTGTDANGQCTVTINSNVAGVFTAHATATTTVSGVVFSLATNGANGNSGDGVKTYVDASIALSPLTAQNPVNATHIVTATVNEDPGTGPIPASGSLVTFTLPTSTATAAFVGSSTCTTNASGTCSVTINSSDPGLITIHAATDVTVGGLTLHRETDGAHGSTGDVAKTYVAGKIIVNKVTNPSSDVTTQFAFANTGTGYNAGFSLVGGGQNNSGWLAPGSYSVAESSTAGWDLASAVCTDGVVTSTPAHITLAAGATVTCTFTNVKRASLKIVKDAEPKDDASSFAFTGGLGGFTLSDDGSGANNSTTPALLVPGSYTVSESEPNQYWKPSVVTCTDTDAQVSYPATVSTSTTGASMTVNLAPGKNVSCTFVNLKTSPTRTLGFWQTHTAFTTSIFNSKGVYVGFSGAVTTGTHKGTLTSSTQVFGAFYAPIPKTTTGAKRSAIDQARVTLLQQLVAAKLNCAAFGCQPSVVTLIANADAAYMNGSAGAIKSYISQLDAFNNSGDTLAITAVGNATPQTSKAIANLSFWDSP